jgi:hypothetical protein
MSYYFDGATQLITSTAPPIADFPITICGWFKPASASATQTMFTFGVSSTTRSFVSIAVNTGPVWSMESVDTGGTGRLFNSSVSLQTNVWQFVCASWDGDTATSTVNSRRIIVNTTKNTSATSFIINAATTWDRLSIGARRRTTIDEYYNGDAAECAAWNAILNDNEIFSMADGVKPSQIRPQNLKFYAPLVRDVYDVFSGTPLTLTNTPTVSDHVRRYG